MPRNTLFSSNMNKMKLFLLLSTVAGLFFVSIYDRSGTSKKEKAEHARLYSPEKYDSLKKTVKQLKVNSTGKPGTKDSLVNFVYRKVFPFWYETDWDFNGTTEVPRKGRIACGYFVTTVLRDAGVKLNRVKLACCASEEMIKTLTSETYIKRYSNVKLDNFCIDLNKKGKGLFVVGLDSHTGFLLNTGDSLFFIHSNGYGWNEHKVIKEIASESKVLESSNYKVVGYFTEDKNFLEQWQREN